MLYFGMAALVGMMVLSVWSGVKNYKQRGFNGVCFEVKFFVNAFLRPMVGMTLMFYTIVGGIAVVPGIKAWSVEQAAKQSTTLGAFLLDPMASVVWLLVVLGVSFWVLFKSYTKRILPYNAEEKQWLAKDIQKSKAYQWLKKHGLMRNGAENVVLK